MFLIRKFGKVICGNATPAQLMLACVLGSMIGFMPGPMQAAGTIALLVMLLILLNANLVLATFAALVAGLVSLLTLPIAFAIGRLLLDGPTQPLMQWAINTPVLALFGFEYYATTGGLVLGLVFGLVVGLVMIKAVKAFRQRMAALEQGSQRYQHWAGKRWVKLARWVLLGGAPKGGYQAALQRHGKVIRPLGVAAVAGLIVLMVLTHFLLADEIVAAALQRGLERANGATVDVRSAELDLNAGRLSVAGLAVTDPNDLKRNLLEADTLTADVSSRDLLRKRMTLDNVTFNNAATGTQRAVPGRRVGTRPNPSKPPEPKENEKTIEDYLEDWQNIKDRLAQVRDWLERIGGGETSDEPTTDPQAPSQQRTLEERLRQRIARQGYAHVRARHLISQVPTLTVRRLEAKQVRAVQLDDDRVNIDGHNLSTHPRLLDEPTRIKIATANSDKLLVDLVLTNMSRAGGDSQLQFHYKRLPVDTLTRNIRFQGGAPLQGGTIDLAMNGTFQSVATPTIDLPLLVRMQNSTLSLGGRSQTIDELPLTLGLRGPIDNPAVALDTEQLAKTLARSGAKQIAREAIKDKAGVDIDQLLSGGTNAEDGDNQNDGASDKAQGLFNKFIGGKDTGDSK
jgi:uncharacterized protein (TIGR03546 family)